MTRKTRAMPSSLIPTVVERSMNRKTNPSATEPNPADPETTFEEFEKAWQKESRSCGCTRPTEFESVSLRCYTERAPKHTPITFSSSETCFRGAKKCTRKNYTLWPNVEACRRSRFEMVLIGLCYPRKRSGYGSSGRYYYRNRTVDWKQELVKVSGAELRGREQGRNDVGADTDTTKRLKVTKAAQPSSEYWPDFPFHY